jgi:hypothetical protein
MSIRRPANLMPTSIAAAFGLALVFALTASTEAQARPWNGITPDEHGSGHVVKKFGKPYREIKGSGKCKSTLNYQAERAIKGTKQVNFCIGAKGKIVQIAVFPAVPILRDDIEEYFGGGYTKKLTDSFVEYFAYPKQGFYIFFNEDRKTVQSLMFTKAQTGPGGKSTPTDSKKQASATP